MAPIEHADAYSDLAEDLEQLFCHTINHVKRSAIRNSIICEVVEETCRDIYVSVCGKGCASAILQEL